MAGEAIGTSKFKGSVRERPKPVGMRLLEQCASDQFGYSSGHIHACARMVHRDDSTCVSLCRHLDGSPHSGSAAATSGVISAGHHSGSRCWHLHAMQCAGDKTCCFSGYAHARARMVPRDVSSRVSLCRHLDGSRPSRSAAAAEATISTGHRDGSRCWYFHAMRGTTCYVAWWFVEHYFVLHTPFALLTVLRTLHERLRSIPSSAG